MRKALLLAWTMFRGTMFGSSSSGSRRRKLRLGSGKTGSRILIGFVIVYLCGLAVMAVKGVYGPLASLNLQSAIPALVVSVGSILTFIFGVMYAMSVYYHSSDVDRLLPLPLLPSQIIFAKFVTTLLYEYLLIWMVGTPALVTYGILNHEGPLFYFLSVITLLVLPVTPLALSSILVILLMRFSPAARNKDRFNMISNIVILALSIGMVFLMQRAQTLDGADLATLLAGSTAEIARVTAGVFPGSAFAAEALAGTGAGSTLLQMAGFLAVAAVAFLVLMYMARLFYLKGVMGVGASFARHRKLSDKEFREAISSGSAFWTYIGKDFKILLRTPVFFLNNIAMNVLFPLFFIGPVLIILSETDSTLPVMIDKVREICFGPEGFAAPIALGVLSAAVIFLCGMNGITASAISREGSSAYFIKIIPMRYITQITAKVSVGVLVSLMPATMMLVLALVILAPPLWFVLLMLIVIASSLLVPNLVGMLFDLRRPKLDWDDEQKAVKQNMNVLYAMLVAMVAGSLAVVPVILMHANLDLASQFWSYLVVLAFPLLVDGLLGMRLIRMGPKKLREMYT